MAREECGRLNLASCGGKCTASQLSVSFESVIRDLTVWPGIRLTRRVGRSLPLGIAKFRRLAWGVRTEDAPLAWTLDTLKGEGVRDLLKTGRSRPFCRSKASLLDWYMSSLSMLGLRPLLVGAGPLLVEFPGVHFVLPLFAADDVELVLVGERGQLLALDRDSGGALCRSARGLPCLGLLLPSEKLSVECLCSELCLTISRGRLWAAGCSAWKSSTTSSGICALRQLMRCFLRMICAWGRKCFVKCLRLTSRR